MGELIVLGEHKKKAEPKPDDAPVLRLPVSFNGQKGTLIVPAASWNALLRYSNAGPQWFVEFGPGEIQWEE